MWRHSDLQRAVDGGTNGSSGEARREERAPIQTSSKPSKKAMQDAVSSMIKSGRSSGSVGARLLEAIRAHSLPSPTRTDERIGALAIYRSLPCRWVSNGLPPQSPDHPKRSAGAQRCR